MTPPQKTNIRDLFFSTKDHLSVSNVQLIDLIIEKLVEHLKKNNINVIGVEGELDSGWILVDCGDIVVNIMKQDQRDFYDLEGLWGENSLLKKFN